MRVVVIETKLSRKAILTFTILISLPIHFSFDIYGGGLSKILSESEGDHILNIFIDWSDLVFVVYPPITDIGIGVFILVSNFRKKCGSESVNRRWEIKTGFLVCRVEGQIKGWIFG